MIRSIPVNQKNHLPVAIIGAGPVGLAAAAHLISKGESFLLFEAGNEVGANIKKWAHVKLFSPWQYNMDKAAKHLLLSAGWVAPGLTDIPTGKELVEQYLKPFSELPEISPYIHLNTKVTAISRKGLSKVRTYGREELPFVIYVNQQGKQLVFEARAVIDATGTWSNPNPIHSDGVFTAEEQSLNSQINYGIPDVLGKDKARYNGKKVLVVGSGHSAIHTLLDLAELQIQGNETEMTWAIRKQNLDDVYGGRELDGLPARGELGVRIQKLVKSGSVKVMTSFYIEQLKQTNGKIQVIGTAGSEKAFIDGVDEIVCNTGSRPDLSFIREVRVMTDPSLESVYELAPLIDPNVHSCGTVRPHGEKELRQSEKDFYIVGSKSYGRAPTFLMATGYEQVRSVVAALVGDMESARKVELELPETGVCSIGAGSGRGGGDSCCEPVNIEAPKDTCCGTTAKPETTTSSDTEA
ncbi:Pyridine nucleotide-disulphide oxidoreductase [Paenibacillus algorifonticola]|uniref:Pyridine nucleotide-disulphide oxidoreductase n=1 Tax=Paenibacillus algorifonticola TaxID=684063 RepID=A0A1I2FJD8_9BACL|nr:NAD(P)-binding domain-containing protein [Paenibacillus algorifonticola]SFF04636.1 Pyridine nucleotide-disulphide oxidoreductase [Paenibacillus algorifonticola]